MHEAAWRRKHLARPHRARQPPWFLEYTRCAPSACSRNTGRRPATDALPHSPPRAKGARGGGAKGARGGAGVGRGVQGERVLGIACVGGGSRRLGSARTTEADWRRAGRRCAPMRVLQWWLVVCVWGGEGRCTRVGSGAQDVGVGRRAGVAAKCTLDTEAHRSRSPLPPCPSPQAAPPAKAPPKLGSRKRGGAGAGEPKGTKRGAPALEGSSNEEGEPVPRERVRGDGARRVVPSAKARGG